MSAPQLHVPTDEEQDALKATASHLVMQSVAALSNEAGIAPISALCLMFMASLRLLASLGGPASRRYAVACMAGCYGNLQAKVKEKHIKQAMKATEDMAAFYEAIPDEPFGRMQ